MKNNKDNNEFAYTIASVDRAIDLLFILENAQGAMGVTELSKLLGVQKSSTHNLLQTLLARGIIQQTDTGQYTLGLSLMRLGSACAERLDVRRVAHPMLAELADETKEVILLAVLDRDEITIIDKVEPSRSFFIVPRFDYKNTFHSTAIGKVFLAQASSTTCEKLINKGLEKFTPYTNTDKAAVYAELKVIKAQGFALSCNETIEGLSCIGAPVYNAKGAVVAAVAASSASAWLTPQRRESLIRILKAKAELISRKMGL